MRESERQSAKRECVSEEKMSTKAFSTIFLSLPLQTDYTCVGVREKALREQLNLIWEIAFAIFLMSPDECPPLLRISFQIRKLLEKLG